MSISYLTQQLSEFSTFERMAIIYYGMGPSGDPIIASAKKQMQSTQVPTYPIDIFRKSFLEGAKALFSPLLKEDPSPGFGISALVRKYGRTLEGYFIDKHLSSSISSKFMIEVLQRIEKAVLRRLGGEKGPYSNREPFYTHAIQSFGACEGDTFVENFKEVNVEVNFIYRVVERLRIQEETKLFQELPLPKFSNALDLKNLREGMKRVQNSGGWLTISCPVKGIEEQDRPIYSEYLNTLFDTRDRRVLKILKESFQKDLEIRKTNPNAPLTHLVTLERYEKAISQQRQVLYTKITVLAIFFFTSACFILLRPK